MKFTLTHTWQFSQQDRAQPTEGHSLEQTSINDVNKEFDEQPGYSLRPAESRDLHVAEQPDSLEDQDDRPEVECVDLDSSENVELPFIDDEAVPEDDLDDDDATLAHVAETSMERPENTAKKKSELVFQYT